MCAFTLTHHIKIDSNGIWWLTRCLNLEKKMGEKTTQGEARGLTHTQQVHARVSANASAIRTTTWVKMEKKEPRNTQAAYCLNTRLKKAHTATCMLPLITLLTSLLTLKPLGRFTTGPLPRKQEETGQESRWQLSDGLLVISTVFKGSLWGSAACSHSTHIIIRTGVSGLSNWIFVLSGSGGKTKTKVK